MLLPTLARYLSRPWSTLQPPCDRVVDLDCGQRDLLELQRGETLLVERGRVTLHYRPQWLGEMLVQGRTELREGEAYVALEGGAVTLAADVACRVRALRRS